MKKPFKIILNTFYIFVLLGISFLASFYLYIPIHETVHSTVCLINGLEPVQERFVSECKGIENASYFGQFFFFMMPYIFSVILLLIIRFTYKKLKFVKFLIFIPIMDIMINYYLSTKQISDFTFLLANTNELLFSFGIVIVLIASLLTIDLIWKTKVLSSNFINSRFSYLSIIC
ncbi:MAG: hypothetical protein QF917_05330 [Candidatus Woesearchaeota archaeon]|jgi:hypothetical protein|nr:hypothetical protein [Candidatus Woesearchaeota archaeon]|tara:strand:+ start:657 stop:1178 length:522 start_codon:yes stop_codon:yes gene_type:complete